MKEIDNPIASGVESTPSFIAGILACGTASTLCLGGKLFAVPLSAVLG